MVITLTKIFSQLKQCSHNLRNGHHFDKTVLATTAMFPQVTSAMFHNAWNVHIQYVPSAMIPWFHHADNVSMVCLYYVWEVQMTSAMLKMLGMFTHRQHYFNNPRNVWHNSAMSKQCYAKDIHTTSALWDVSTTSHSSGNTRDVRTTLCNLHRLLAMLPQRL